MKKLLLPSLISALLLAGCGAEEKKDPTLHAEETFNRLVSSTEANYQAIADSSPYVKSISYKTISYDKKDNDTANAVTQLLINIPEFAGKEQIQFTFNSLVKYDAATINADLIEEVQTTLADLTEMDTLSPDAMKIVEGISCNTKVDVKEVYDQLCVVKGFTIPDAKNVTVGEIKLASSSKLDDVAKGFLDSFKFSFGGVNEGGTDNRMDAFELAGFYKPSGDFEINLLAPFKFVSRDFNVTLEELSGEGNLLPHEEFPSYVGSAYYSLFNLEIKNNRQSLERSILGFDSITINSDAEINSDDIASQAVNISIMPKAGSFKAISRGQLDLSEITLAVNVDNLPAEVLSLYQDAMQKAYAGDLGGLGFEALIEESETAFVKMKAEETEMGVNLKVSVAEGDITADIKMNLIADSTVTFSELVSSRSPKPLLELIKLDANMSVPAAFLDKTGAQMFVGPYIKKEGDAYTVVLKTENGQLLINGVPAPF